MFDRSERDKLLQQKERLLDASDDVEVQDDPMKQYNFVIACYNTDQNRVGTIELKPMPEYCLYHYFWKILSNPCFLLIYILLIMVPALGALLYLLILIACIEYFIGLSHFRANQRRVPDPFQNMIFCPELCKAAKSINKYYEIDANGIFF